MIVSLCVAAVCLLATQARSQDHWYWQDDPANEKHFRNVDNPDDQVYMRVDGEAIPGTIWRCTWTISGVLQEESEFVFSIDSDGSVWWLAWYEPQNLPDTPFLFIDAPLELGNSWEQWISWGAFCAITLIR